MSQSRLSLANDQSSLRGESTREGSGSCQRHGRVTAGQGPRSTGRGTGRRHPPGLSCGAAASPSPGAGDAGAGADEHPLPPSPTADAGGWWGRHLPGRSPARPPLPDGPRGAAGHLLLPAAAPGGGRGGPAERRPPRSDPETLFHGEIASFASQTDGLRDEINLGGQRPV